MGGRIPPERGEVAGARGKYELTLLKLLEKSTIIYDPGGVRVDGKLTEWTELPLTVNGSGHFRYGEERWTGPEDTSCRFGARHNDEFLYIGVDVTDDDLVYRADKQYPWEQDGVEVRVDARPDPRRSLSQDGGDQEMTTYITVWMAPGRMADEVFLMAGDSIARLGVEVSGLFTDTGYTCEVAVPLSYVIERQGEDWDKIRVNVTIDDRDGDEGLCQLWWHPHWSRGDSFPGSGTLVRK